MPRDRAVEAQRAAILRDELARTRARLAQAVRQRDDLAVRVDTLLGLLVRRRALSASAARRLLRDLEAALSDEPAVPSERTGELRLLGSAHPTPTHMKGPRSA